MKKIISGVVLGLLVLSVGSYAFAQEDMKKGMCEKDGIINFGHMKNKMQEMHPELSIEELQEKYRKCHGTLGASPSKNFKDMGKH